MEETASLKVSALAAQERWAWAAYGLHAFGLFLFWPALLGLAINYIKAGDGPDGNVDTHHPYMRKTFWISFWIAVLVIATMVVGLLLLLFRFGLDVSTIATDTAVQIRGLSLEHAWIPVVAVLGGLMLLAVWLWAVFRTLRGMIRLGEDKSAL
ncbi:MAG: hypothetical protein ACRCV9_10945 [Burkholderiaceae bacterium]